MPGAVTLLDELGAAGIARALVTSAPARLAHAMLSARGVADRFEAVVCGDEVAAGKPPPTATARRSAGWACHPPTPSPAKTPHPV